MNVKVNALVGFYSVYFVLISRREKISVFDHGSCNKVGVESECKEEQNDERPMQRSVMNSVKYPSNGKCKKANKSKNSQEIIVSFSKYTIEVSIENPSVLLHTSKEDAC